MQKYEYKFWCLRQESNLLRLALQANALPVELRGRMVPAKKIELMTYCVWSNCSDLLSYAGMWRLQQGSNLHSLGCSQEP